MQSKRVIVDSKALMVVRKREINRWGMIFTEREREKDRRENDRVRVYVCERERVR